MRVEIEATGHARCFERLLVELNFELQIGDPAEIRAERVREQKTDRQDAEHLLKLLVEEAFSKDMGTESGKSGSALTALASASSGVDVNAGLESVAGHRHERRRTAQAETLAPAGMGTVGVLLAGSLDRIGSETGSGVAEAINSLRPSSVRRG